MEPKLYALALLFELPPANGRIQTYLRARACIATSPEQAVDSGFALARNEWPHYEAGGWQLSVTAREIEIDARIRKVVENA